MIALQYLQYVGTETESVQRSREREDCGNYGNLQTGRTVRLQRARFREIQGTPKLLVLRIFHVYPRPLLIVVFLLFPNWGLEVLNVDHQFPTECLKEVRGPI